MGDSSADAMRLPFSGPMAEGADTLDEPDKGSAGAGVAVGVEAPSGAGAGTVPPDSAPSLAERFLLRRLHRGDPRAFAELVHRHQDRVYALTLRMLGDPHEAEDVAQDVFVAVHRHVGRFRGESRLSTWIYRITRNHCLNRLKRRANELSAREAAIRHGESGPEGFSTTPPMEPDRALLAAEERLRVRQALDRLDPMHRLLVVLRDIEGMSYEDLARIAELPLGTVKSRLHRARSALARVLVDEGMAPDPATSAPIPGKKAKEHV